MSPILDSIGSVKGYGWGAFSELPPSFYSIQTLTASGGETVLTFNSIPSTYTSLQIRGIANYGSGTNTAGASLLFRVNGDSGSNYSIHFFRGDGTSTFVGANASMTRTLIDRAVLKSSDSSNGATVIDIHDYASTSKRKVIRYISGNECNIVTGDNAGVSVGSALWNSTSAITSITIGVDGSYTFGAGTSFALYGIKGE